MLSEGVCHEGDPDQKLRAQCLDVERSQGRIQVPWHACQTVQVP